MVCCVAVSAQNVTLPRPPAELRSVPQRAGWLTEHYWQNCESLSAHQADSTGFEQAFVNFLSLFPITESDSLCRSAVSAIMHRAQGEGTACRKVFDTLADKYLYDLDSPLANEEYYLFFLDAAASIQGYTDLERADMDYRRSVVMNNRVGGPVEEFYFETVSGRLVSLHDVKGRRLLLIFDPACKECMQTLAALKAQSPEGYKVVAIAVNCDRAAFASLSGTVPADWEYGWDCSGTVNGQAFALRKTPDIYLIDADGTVIAKHWRLTTSSD